MSPMTAGAPLLLFILLLLIAVAEHPSRAARERRASPCVPDSDVDALWAWIDAETPAALRTSKRKKMKKKKSGLCVGPHPVRGDRALFVRRRVKKGQVLLTVPLILTLNRLTAADPPLALVYPPPHSVSADGGAGSIETMAALFLLHARHTAREVGSRWGPYIDVLPTPFALKQAASRGHVVPPLFYTPAQREAVRRSGAGRLIQAKWEDIEGNWAQLFGPEGALTKGKAGRRAFGHPAGSSLKKFRWAMAMVQSRSFKIPRPWEASTNGSLPVTAGAAAVNSEGDLRFTMVPGADLANFSPNPSTFLRVQGPDL